MSSNEVTPINPITDPYGFLRIIKNPDGSITRKQKFIDLHTSPTIPSDSIFENHIPILIKDIPINKDNNTWARLYLRRPEPNAILSTTAKQPLIVYFHGGGFILGSASTSMFHNFCCRVAEETPAVIVSVEYHLAPEHRLPAAYDDGIEVLHWIKTAAEEWLRKYADFSKCFLMGSSAGGNIAYHVGLRAVACGDDLMPLEIRGLILCHPFFSGVERTPSEIKLANDKVCPPSAADIMWDLALPVGADRDHEYCNPMVGIKSNLLEMMKDQRWKIMVISCDGDPLVDRDIEFMKMLTEKGLDVVCEISEGGCHGYEFVDETRAKILYGGIKNFILSLKTSSSFSKVMNKFSRL